ncbi:MAG: restriction endonuclease subunit S [Ferruginibacter sp.]
MKGFKYIKSDRTPKDWGVYYLHELGTLSKGKGILKDQLTAVGLPCIRYGEIYTKHNYFIKKFHSFIPEAIAAESQKIKKGVVLFAGSGETLEDIGKAVAYDGDEIAFAGGDIIILATNEKVNSLYLSYFLNTDIANKQKRKLGAGHSVVHIYPTDLRKLEILLPPIEVQNKIVSLFKVWDATIQIITALLTQKLLLKKGLMQELLTGKKRLKGFKGKWKEFKIKNIADVIKGSGLSKEQIKQNGKYHCLLYGELFTTYGNEIQEVISKTDSNEGVLSKPGDILIPGSTTTSGIDLSKASVLTIKNIRLGGDINIVRQRNDVYHPQFLSYYITHVKKKEIVKLAQGITIIHLYAKDISNLCISLPCIEEQMKVAEIISSLEKEIELYEKQHAFYKQQKKGLMQQLLTGKKRVKAKQQVQL